MLKHKSDFFILLIIALVSTSCHYDNGSNTLYQQQLFTFGTLVDISVLSDNPEQAEKAINLISAEFDRLHIAWHPWKNGDLAQANQRFPGLEAFSSTASVISLIEQSQVLSEKSNGLFNPAIGQLIKAWQFDQIEDEDHPFSIPDREQIQRLLLQKPQMQDIVIETTGSGTEINSINPAVSLDFGAFAKGAAVEKMIQILKNNNIHNGLINAGGDLKVIGAKNGHPWHIGIKNPSYTRNPEQPAILATIELYSGEALFTSGDYERFFEFQGKHYHHIIDPRSGFPAVGTRSVTVLAKDAGLADAASTALFIAGAEQWQEIAAKMDIEFVLLVTTDDQIYLSPAMAERVKLLVNNKLHLEQGQQSRIGDSKNQQEQTQQDDRIAE